MGGALAFAVYGEQHGRRPSRRMPDADFRRMVDEAVAGVRLSELISGYTVLKPAGRELVGLCPFHEERRPSFRVNDARGTYFCFGCSARGDALRFLMDKRGLSFADALRDLSSGVLPTISADERAKLRQEEEADRERAIADAQAMWAAGVSIDGTPGETYLREVRGITGELPASIRFGFVPTKRDVVTGDWSQPYPAVMCANTTGDDEVVGLQRIFVRDDGMGKRWGKRSKLSLGRPKGAAFKLADAAPEVILCEGPEDGLSLAVMLPGSAVWVAMGTAMMPDVVFPSMVQRIVIAGQNDAAGRAAVDKSAATLTLQGFSVRTLYPDERFADWNDELCGVAR